MRETELREHADCSFCGKPIGHTGLPMFWTVEIHQHGLKVDALQRQQGLTMMLGGHAGLAHVMGPDEDMTTEMMKVEITLCQDCGVQNLIHLIGMNDAI
jgi:hypothetical protein